jgi:hypothetical protein
MRHRLLQRHLHNHVYCSTIHNSQVWKQPRSPTTDKWIKKMCYLYTMEFYSAMKKNDGWNWRTSFWARLTRLRRPKIICSPSYADFRSRANTAMVLDLCHMLRGEHIWGLVRNPKHESVWCPQCRGANTETLKRQRSIWEGDQKLVKRSGRGESTWVVTHLCMDAMLGFSLYSYPYLN